MRKPAEIDPMERVQEIIEELLGYTAMLEDMTARKVEDGMFMTDNGLSGLNSLFHYMRRISAEALDNLPLK